MKQKRTPKTADEKDLDTLWAVMRWAVDMRQTSLCHHVNGHATGAQLPLDG